MFKGFFFAMLQGVDEWDERYRGGHGDAAEPAEILRECSPLLPRGPALDLACGTGRNTLFLAADDHSVTAVDFSAVALAELEGRARAAGRIIESANSVSPPHGSRGHIRLVQADLERIALPESAFEIVLCFQYLQRSLFSGMMRTLRAGGVLLFETYTRAQLAFAGGPRNPAHLLEQGELRAAFPSLEILFYRELRAGKGIATLVARKPKQ